MSEITLESLGKQFSSGKPYFVKYDYYWDTPSSSLHMCNDHHDVMKQIVENIKLYENRCMRINYSSYLEIDIKNIIHFKVFNLNTFEIDNIVTNIKNLYKIDVDNLISNELYYLTFKNNSIDSTTIDDQAKEYTGEYKFIGYATVRAYDGNEFYNQEILIFGNNNDTLYIFKNGDGYILIMNDEGPSIFDIYTDESEESIGQYTEYPDLKDDQYILTYSDDNYLFDVEIM